MKKINTIICCMLAVAFTAAGCTYGGEAQAAALSVTTPPAQETAQTDEDKSDKELYTEAIGIEKTQEVGERRTSVERETKNVTVTYITEYPFFSNEAIDGHIAEILAEMKSGFSAEVGLAEAYSENELRFNGNSAAFLYVEYESYLYGENIISLVFHEKQEAELKGFPKEDIHIYLFSKETGKEIDGEKLKRSGFAGAASQYAIEYFTSVLPYKDRIYGDYEKTLDPENGKLDSFALTDEGALFYFKKYELFPGSMGTVKLTVPYEALGRLLKGTDGAEAEPDIDPEKPMVALTFDDGPNPIHTERILDVLEEYDVTATFFDLGSLAEKYPDTVKRETALGCEVGSHSYDHKNFNTLTGEQIAYDVRITAEAFKKILGYTPSLFRPPYGNCNAFVKKNIPMAIVTWSVDTRDWESRDPEAIMRVIKNEGNLDGKVILMHGIYGSSAEAVEELVPYLLKEGYQLVTVSQMLEYKHGVSAPQAGFLYGYAYF